MKARRRDPQMALRLDAAESGRAWREGTELSCLGDRLYIALGSADAEARREGNALILPLPPEATPRQVQDRAEAWLREEAVRVFQRLIEQKSAAAGRQPPRLALSFAARAHWVEAQGTDTLRCNWRLVEQPLPAIEQAIARGIAALPPAQGGFDLFGTPLATG